MAASLFCDDVCSLSCCLCLKRSSHGDPAHLCLISFGPEPFLNAQIASFHKDRIVSRVVMLRRAPAPADPRVSEPCHVLKRRSNLQEGNAVAKWPGAHHVVMFCLKLFFFPLKKKKLLCWVSSALSLGKQRLTCKYLAFLVWEDWKAHGEMKEMETLQLL